MTKDTVTPSGAGGVSSRQEMMDEIDRARIDEVNQILPDAEKLEFKPTPEIRKAAGKDATDDGRQDDDKVDEANLDDKADEGKTGKTAAEDKSDKSDKTDETIYDFLGEEKLGTTKVKTKVDGVETELSVADLVRGHQKTVAADKRLEEASITKKKAQEEADQVIANARTEAEKITAAAKTAAGKKDSNVDDDGKDKKDSPSGKDAILSATQLIYDGHQEEAAGILDAEIDRRVAAKAGGATIDETELTGKIRTQLSWDNALSEFNRDHKEIAQDPELARMFQRHLNEVAATSETPQEAITKATEKVTGWLKQVSGRTDDDGKKTELKVDDKLLEKRKQDKAETDSVRSNSSIRSQSNSAQEEKIPSNSDTIAEMKKARGQS